MTDGGVVLNTGDIRKIEALALAASGGRGLAVQQADPRYRPTDFLTECLSHGDGPVYAVGVPDDLLTGREEPVVCITGNGPTSKANAEFFSLARKAVLALIADNRALRRALAGADAP